MPTVLCGWENWPPALREKLRLMVFENRALRKITVRKEKKVTEGWRKLSTINFMICVVHHILFG